MNLALRLMFIGTIDIVYKAAISLIFHLSNAVRLLRLLYIDQLVTVIDNHVEKVDYYNKRIESEYSLIEINNYDLIISSLSFYKVAKYSLS